MFSIKDDFEPLPTEQELHARQNTGITVGSMLRKEENRFSFERVNRLLTQPAERPIVERHGDVTVTYYVASMILREEW